MWLIAEMDRIPLPSLFKCSIERVVIYDVSFTAFLAGDMILTVTLEKGGGSHRIFSEAVLSSFCDNFIIDPRKI